MSAEAITEEVKEKQQMNFQAETKEILNIMINSLYTRKFF